MKKIDRGGFAVAQGSSACLYDHRCNGTENNEAAKKNTQQHRWEENNYSCSKKHSSRRLIRAAADLLLRPPLLSLLHKHRQRAPAPPRTPVRQRPHFVQAAHRPQEGELLLSPRHCLHSALHGVRGRKGTRQQRARLV